MNTSIELVSTGSELLNGRTVNRHAQVLGEQVRPLGFVLARDTTVPDDPAAIRDALASALQRVDVVVVSGGLGPTGDDVTRDAIAAHLGRKVVTDGPSLDLLRRRYAKAGRTVTRQSELQAQVVEGAAALRNAVGVAPGERLDLDGKTVFVLPGPPDEFMAVLTDHVLTWLRERAGGGSLPPERVFEVCGIPESDILRLFQENNLPPAGVDVAYSAAPGRIEVRLFSTGAEPAVLDTAATQVRAILGDSIFAEERLAMEEVVGKLLLERKATVAVAESCTGGLIGHRLTAVSGSSAYFVGGVVAYSNDVKTGQLGVEADTLKREGAVSEAVARQMAEGVRARLKADYGVAVTGIAGPTGGTAEKPVGLVFVAVADARGTWAGSYRFSGHRARIKEWSAQTALDALRRRVLGKI